MWAQASRPAPTDSLAGQRQPGPQIRDVVDVDRVIGGERQPGPRIHDVVDVVRVTGPAHKSGLRGISKQRRTAGAWLSSRAGPSRAGTAHARAARAAGAR